MPSPVASCLVEPDAVAPEALETMLTLCPAGKNTTKSIGVRSISPAMLLNDSIALSLVPSFMLIVIKDAEFWLIVPKILKNPVALSIVVVVFSKLKAV